MNENEDYEELPSIIVNTTDSGKFVMPEADVLASQRLLEVSRENEIKRVRAEIAAGEDSGSDGELAYCIEALRVEAPASILYENPGLLPTSIDILEPYLTTTQYCFLENFLSCLKYDNTAAVDKAYEHILMGIECTIEREEHWNTGDILCIGMCLCLMCIKRPCHQTLRHLSAVRSFLYYLIDHICLEPEKTTLLGTMYTKLITDPRDRLEFALVLEGGAGYNSINLAVGIVRSSLQELLDESDKQVEWSDTPYSTKELLALIVKKWKSLSTSEQFLVASFLSRALIHNEDSMSRLGKMESEDNVQGLSVEVGAHEELLSFLSTNISHGYSEHATADNLKLQVLVSKIQLLHRLSNTNRLIDSHKYLDAEDRDLFTTNNL